MNYIIYKPNVTHNYDVYSVNSGNINWKKSYIYSQEKKCVSQPCSWRRILCLPNQTHLIQLISS